MCRPAKFDKSPRHYRYPDITPRAEPSPFAGMASVHSAGWRQHVNWTVNAAPLMAGKAHLSSESSLTAAQWDCAVIRDNASIDLRF